MILPDLKVISVLLLGETLESNFTNEADWLKRDDVLDRAAAVFASLKMHKTKLRNGILFYLAIKDHKFAILGDGGINAVIPNDFWDNIKEMMKQKFKEGDFTAGLSSGIKISGEQLKAHFPYQSDDINELEDDISFG